MKWMQKYIFNLFLLIAILTLSSIYISDKYFYGDGSKLSKRIFILQEKINSIKIKLNTKEDYIQTALNIESYIQKNNIKMIDTKISKNKIVYTLSSELKNLLEFVKYCETKYKKVLINTLSLKNINTQNKVTMYISLSLNEKYTKRVFKENLYKEKLSYIDNKNFDLDKYKLYAIVGNNVLINKKWLKINDLINKYKLVKIQKDYIELDNGFNHILMKLYDDK